MKPIKKVRTTRADHEAKQFSEHLASLKAVAAQDLDPEKKLRAERMLEKLRPYG